MTALFSSPKTYTPPPPAATAAPTQTSAEVQAVADSERARQAQAAGRNSTILTALDTSAGAPGGKTLLGSG